MFIYSSMDEHWGCCHLLANVNNVIMNMEVQISLQNPAFNFGDMPGSGIAGSCVNPIFYFWGPSILFFKAEVLFYISISPPPCQHLSFSVFLDSYFILLSVSSQFPLLVSFIFSIPRSRCLGTFLCLCSTSHPIPPLTPIDLIQTHGCKYHALFTSLKSISQLLVLLLICRPTYSTTYSISLHEWASQTW